MGNGTGRLRDTHNTSFNSSSMSCRLSCSTLAGCLVLRSAHAHERGNNKEEQNPLQKSSHAPGMGDGLPSSSRVGSTTSGRSSSPTQSTDVPDRDGPATPPGRRKAHAKKEEGRGGLA